MKNPIDVQHPWFIPLWRRIATVGASLGWAALEISWGHPGWAALFGFIGLYCAHQFFIAFDPPRPDQDAAPKDDT